MKLINDKVDLFHFTVVELVIIKITKYYKNFEINVLSTFIKS